jgi:uncharacterized protein
VTPERLRRVEEAEAALLALGFRVVRVRDHHPVARIEVDPGEIARFFDPEVRERVSAGVRAAGFAFVALDLGGYRQGAMHEALPEDLPEAAAPSGDRRRPA